MFVHVRTFRQAPLSAIILPFSDPYRRCEAWHSSIAPVVARFPLRELEIRRRYVRDQKFKEICEDYSEALEALQRWEGTGPEGDAKAEDYRRIRDELEAEIVATLDGPL